MHRLGGGSFRSLISTLPAAGVGVNGLMTLGIVARVGGRLYNAGNRGDGVTPANGEGAGRNPSARTISPAVVSRETIDDEQPISTNRGGVGGTLQFGH